MKTVTIEWDEYHAEMQAKYEKGLEMGLWKAARFLEDAEQNPIDDKYTFERNYLEKQRDKLVDLRISNLMTPRIPDC